MVSVFAVPDVRGSGFCPARRHRLTVPSGDAARPTMSPSDQLTALLAGPHPLLALAPMQNVTDGAFWALIHGYGGADVYWTEYFRVHVDSTPEKWIVDSIRDNATGRPVVAQMIGNDIPALVRTVKALQELPIAAIDLNLGCSAPIA